MTSSTGSLVLRAQPDKAEALKQIAYSLDRLYKLYQIPNWSADNSVLLAEWIFDNYNCEPLELIVKTLNNPPDVEKDNWRLTPDVISKWMKIALEKYSQQIEKENLSMKPEVKEELPNVDYESFKKRISSGALPEVKPPNPFKDPGYLEFKNQRMIQQMKNKKP